jgi:hypothetical protein
MGSKSSSYRRSNSCTVIWSIPASPEFFLTCCHSIRSRLRYRPSPMNSYASLIASRPLHRLRIAGCKGPFRPDPDVLLTSHISLLFGTLKNSRSSPHLSGFLILAHSFKSTSQRCHHRHHPRLPILQGRYLEIKFDLILVALILRFLFSAPDAMSRVPPRVRRTLSPYSFWLHIGSVHRI